MTTRRWSGLVAVACALLSVDVPAQQGRDRFEPPATVGTLVTITGPKERGTRMIVTGRVVDAHNRPRAGIVIGVYQTDARGFYGENSVASPIARLHGWVKTDSLGRYEVRTIRPGAYPGGGTPAHIHFLVGGVNQELRFADPHPAADRKNLDWMSPPATERPGDTFAMVRPVMRDRDGVEHVVRDFRLK